MPARSTSPSIPLPRALPPGSRSERALVQTEEPVNKFPDLVAYMVRSLKMMCPTLGKVRIAQMLARSSVFARGGRWPDRSTGLGSHSSARGFVRVAGHRSALCLLRDHARPPGSERERESW